MEYVPDGLTKEQWKKMKQKEKDKNKNLKFNGTSGMKFRSRSMADFLEGREKGLYKYNMPLEGDVKKLLRERKSSLKMYHTCSVQAACQITLT